MADSTRSGTVIVPFLPPVLAGLAAIALAASAIAAPDNARLRTMPGAAADSVPAGTGGETVQQTAGGGTCGNGAPDAGEACDDGNTTGGDGCSATCTIEPGFDCTAAQAGGDINAIADGGFETGTPNLSWTEASANYDSPICDPISCGTGGGTGANTGAWWAWFGGVDPADASATLPESSSVSQFVTIPSGVTTMTLAVENTVCDGPDDILELSIDGQVLLTVTGNDANCGVVGYRTETVDISAYADDAAHELRLDAQTFGTNGDVTNFFVDDLFIDAGDLAPQPSVCTLVAETCYAEDFDPALGGNLGSVGWSTFTGDTDATGALWGTTDDAVCGSGDGLPGNFTGGVGDAACVDSDVAGSGQTDTYLCSSTIDLAEATGATLNFLYSYHTFGEADVDDLFQVLVGTTAPDATSVLTYTEVLFNNGADQGTLFDLPGATESIDVSLLDGAASAWVCFRYGADFDWYAQVDDVSVTATPCSLPPPDTDGDGIDDTVDNCTTFANADQTDTDGDGHGNACDADLNNDCGVNFGDLAELKAVFFPLPPDPEADFTGDGFVNFADLARMKQTFFNGAEPGPGPSAAGLCSGP